VGEEGGKKGEAGRKMGMQKENNGTCVQPVGDRWSRFNPIAAALFLNFFDFFEFFFWNVEVLLGIWGEWVHNIPIFSRFPLHLEVSNLPFFITFGDFTFLGILFFLNLEYTWTFISTVRIFVSCKNEITKNSTSFASVMEVFFYPSSVQGAFEYVPLIVYL
jgi:hypothetical protein